MPDQEWFSAGLRFTCTQCGQCCSGPPGYVWFTDAEAQALATRLGLSVAEFRQQYAKQHGEHWSLQEKLTEHGYDCVFLERDESGKALCMVYEDRPAQCRTWPFWPENLHSPAAWRRTATRCPGMDHGTKGRGKLYPAEQIRIIRDAHPTGP